MSKIIPIKLSLSQAYLVQGAGGDCILVDTGSPGEEEKILAAVARAGIAVGAIRLLVHTHGHVDHAGSTVALAQKLGVPTAVHSADASLVQTGRMNPLTPLRLEARLIKPFVSHPFPPFTPDLWLDETFALADWGIDGQILPTPGHTAGSISLLFPDNSAIVGDVLMGGYMGGNILPHRPNYHYFADDVAAVHHSLQALVAAGVQTFYPGHGGAITATAVVHRWHTLFQEAT
jgi:hydroxyacylglutathione hydrolase